MGVIWVISSQFPLILVNHYDIEDPVTKRREIELQKDFSSMTTTSSIERNRGFNNSILELDSKNKTDGCHKKDKYEVWNEGKLVIHHEGSQPMVGLASNSTPSPSENRSKRRRIGLNKEPRERSKKKWYWPKIAVECNQKMPKLSTLAPQTPKRSPQEKRKYVRKNNVQTCPSENFDPSGSLHEKKRKCVMENYKKPCRPFQNVDPLENVNENKVKSSFLEYIDHSEYVEKSDGAAKSCKRALSFELQNIDASTQIVSVDQKSPSINRTICIYKYNSLYVYRRMFRRNDCPSNSRKLGPNFPRMCMKKRIMRRKGAAWFRNRLMGNDGSKDADGENEAREKSLEEQRQEFRGLVDSFIVRMNIIQGNRSFSQWNGSVIDSVVAVFLTQNVTDVHSSSAYMSLASKFPLGPTNNHSKSVGVEEILFSQDSVGLKSNTEEIGKACDANGKLSLSQETEQEMSHQSEEKGKETVVIKTCFPYMDIDSMAPFGDLTSTKAKDLGDKSENLGCVEFVKNETVVLPEVTTPKHQEEIFFDLDMSLSKCQVPLKSNWHAEKNENVPRTVSSSRRKGNKVEKKQAKIIDWDNLRKTYAKGHRGRDNNSDTMDSVDWEAVRHANLKKLSKCIRERGQQRIIAKRIQKFLDRVVHDHGSLDLEWLRDVPSDKTKEYLLSVKGLGLKSAECVRLLTLHDHAFPVDTNVNRIVVRLGWVPLQPLPEDIHLHLLKTYPVRDAVQNYLWPRLCTLDRQTLYELHYQMITFGKVFCTKENPNCGPCPMRGECGHYASAVASLNASADQRMDSSKDSSIPSFQELDAHITQTALSLLKANLSDNYLSKSCEPFIEYPASPDPGCSEARVRDIEDYGSKSKNVIATFRLNPGELKKSLLDYLSKINTPLPEDDMSKALVIMTSRAASKPAPELKSESRLRTVHQVYELPDTHPLVQTLDKREPDDPCPYLLAVWIQATNSGKPPCNSQESELCKKWNNFQQEDSQTVCGTILIPCRTAMRGRFPLNGTYFQVNEVFADNESMKHPINVPQAWTRHLHQRHLYCATKVASIFEGLSTEEVQYCFWKGYICVRAFDRKTRAPRLLGRKFHIKPKSTATRKKRAHDIKLKSTANRKKRAHDN